MPRCAYAQIRYILPVSPPQAARTWEDVSYDYLEALAHTTLVTCALGNSPDIVDLRPGSRYHAHHYMFVGAATYDGAFVNLVSAPFGRGTPPRQIPVGDGSFQIDDPELLADLTQPAAFDLCRLFTVSVPNIAIVGFQKDRNGKIVTPSDDERTALRDYNALIVTSEPTRSAILGLGLFLKEIGVITPDEPAKLEAFLRRYLPDIAVPARL